MRSIDLFQFIKFAKKVLDDNDKEIVEFKNALEAMQIIMHSTMEIIMKKKVDQK